MLWGVVPGVGVAVRPLAPSPLFVQQVGFDEQNMLRVHACSSCKLELPQANMQRHEPQQFKKECAAAVGLQQVTICKSYALEADKPCLLLCSSMLI